MQTNPRILFFNVFHLFHILGSLDLDMTNFRNKKHLAFVRSHECCVCGEPQNTHAHHLRVNQGMAMKSGDDWTVPLCPGCHVFGRNAVHTIGSKKELDWFKSHNIDARALAAELYEESPYKDHQPVKKKRKTTRGKFAGMIKSRGFPKKSKKTY